MPALIGLFAFLFFLPGIKKEIIRVDLYNQEGRYTGPTRLELATSGVRGRYFHFNNIDLFNPAGARSGQNR